MTRRTSRGPTPGWSTVLLGGFSPPSPESGGLGVSGGAAEAVPEAGQPGSLADQAQG